MSSPGCFSAADEMDDLFANAAEALALWTEAMIADRQEIPAPLWGLRWHGHESLRLPPSLRAKRSNPVLFKRVWIASLLAMTPYAGSSGEDTRGSY
ncbi:type II toxin-antitoxin system HicB family antitoxin [Methylovirgula sp. HY1]|uniref:type II toxin-antitoxin system HicB family antitoxin n=1 Tax=Methylovirgula sp. HY1 TaxID=2822761 RepID=UPI001C5BE5CA|nr:type II toxin-antitoxin system HicB family antitoxin [Methylovirgula sp. HY1]QXX75601.1 hypothetical protein MHY1_02431 [Methylovirgula sp. HY1]